MFISKTARIIIHNGEYYINIGSKQEKISEVKLKTFLTEYEKGKMENSDAFDVFFNSSFIVNKEQDFPEDIFYKSTLYEEIIIGNNKIEKDKKILILGCGGIGNFILFALCSHGFTNFILIDGDTIEESNLNRQFLFDREDIGKYKVEALKKKIESKFNNINMTIFPHMCTSDTLKEFNDADFIIVSADSDDSLEIVNDFSLEYKIPYIPVGYLNDISVIGPLVIPSITSCHECLRVGSDIVTDSVVDKKLLELIEKVNNKYQAPSAFTNNAIASSMAINDILLYFADEFGKIKSINKRVGIDNITFEKYEIPIEKNGKCRCALS